MELKQGNVLQGLRGIQGFLDTHADILGAVVTSGARRKLDAQVVELDAHVKAQGGNGLAARDATLSQAAAREVLLREHMAPIARVAAAELPPSPELQPLRLPTRRLSTEVLYAAAISMADAAEPRAAVFIAALLPEDFIARLRAAAAAMRVALDEGRRRRVARKGATASLADELTNARRTVKMLDAVVRVALKGKPGLLASWDAVKRFQLRTSKGAATTGASATPVIPPAPATPMDSPAPVALVAA